MVSFKNIISELHWEIGHEARKWSKKLTSSYRHYGFNDLPDEIVSDILVRDCRDSSYNFEQDRPFRLQRTCKRFKALLDTNPECWSIITSAVNLKKHLQMCSTFHVVVDEGTKSEFFKKCVGSLGMKSLEFWQHYEAPRLPKWFKWDWSLPQLTKLESPFVPPPGLFPALVHCSLRTRFWYDDEDDSEDSDFLTRRKIVAIPHNSNDAKTAQFLATTPLLQSLSLSVSDDRSLGSNRSPTCVSLHHLKYLHLTAYVNHDTDTFSFKTRLLKSLTIPNCECMRISVIQAGCRGRGAVQCGIIFPFVKTLIIDTSSMHVQCIHSAFPALRHLDAGYSDMLSDECDCNADKPNLQLFKTITCDGRLMYVGEAFDWYKANGAELDRVKLLYGKFDSKEFRKAEKMISTIFPKAIIRPQFTRQ